MSVPRLFVDLFVLGLGHLGEVISIVVLPLVLLIIVVLVLAVVRIGFLRVIELLIRGCQVVLFIGVFGIFLLDTAAPVVR